MEAYKCIIIPILGTVQCDNKAELNLWKKKKNTCQSYQQKMAGMQGFS